MSRLTQPRPSVHAEMLRKVRWEYVGMALLLVLVTVVSIVATQRSEGSGTLNPITVTTQSSQVNEPPVVLVIGDSYTEGSAMSTPGREWPELLAAANGWIVFRDGVGGSGYLSNGQGVRFGKRIPTDLSRYLPDMIILAGGINDSSKFSATKVGAAAARDIRLVKQSGAEIVVLSPFWPGTPPESLTRLASTLERVASNEGVAFENVSECLIGPLNWVGFDGVHPTDAGHRQLASCIGRRLPTPEADRVHKSGSL